MWWLIGAVAWLIMGVITYSLYGRMLWKVATDQKRDFEDWFYEQTNGKIYLIYLIGWPYFLLTMSYSYVKFRLHERGRE